MGNLVFFEKTSSKNFRKEKLISWIANTYWQDAINQERAIKLIETIKSSPKKVKLLEILETEALNILSLYNSNEENEGTRYFDVLDRIYTHYTWSFCSEMLDKGLISQHILENKPWEKKKDLSFLKVIEQNLTPSTYPAYLQKVVYPKAKRYLINLMKKAIWDDAINLKRISNLIAKIESIDADAVMSASPSQLTEKNNECDTIILNVLKLEIESIYYQDLKGKLPHRHNDLSRYYDFLCGVKDGYRMKADPGLMICNGHAGIPERVKKESKDYEKHKEKYKPSSEERAELAYK